MIPDDEQNIINVELEGEMKKSFIDYAMSVIVDRALPDVRDGLKPVHRRILYGMYELGYTPDKPYKKAVSTVGEVLRKFHPHGDAAVYDSMVRLAQDFSMREPLVDGHGNFGSVDGDPPAAMRYTEARLTKISLEMLRDIDKETVDFIPNFDNTEQEPTALPSRFPNLLVNGSSGIAVGMTTNIPPHNLCEVIDGVIKVIDDDNVSIEDLMKIIKGPDFPTGAMIMGRDGIKDVYTKGRGRIVVRAVTNIEEMSGNRQRIIVSEIPYQVNKAQLIMKIADLVKEKRIEGISDIRDESDREGMRIVIELKRDVNANIVLNQLFKHTEMQSAFNAIMLALVDGEPKVLTLRDFIDRYLEHQRSVIIRRTQFDLKKAEARAHILEGLRIALDYIDEVIAIIRAAYDDAKERLMERFKLTDIQAQAILDMRLKTLSGLQREKIEEEYNALMAEIKRLKEILGSEALVFEIIKNELLEIKTKYGSERKTKIVRGAEDFEVEDLIEDVDNVITLTHFGYVKRLPVDTYKNQHRGGRGISGLTTREEDFVENLFIASTHQYILFFTNLGKVYRLKAHEIPEAGRQAKGTAIVNLLQLSPGEKVQAVIPIRSGEEEGKFILIGTQEGIIKKTPLSEFDNIRKGGIIAITIKEEDRLVDIKLTDGKCNIILATQSGIAIRFKEEDVRPTGRASMGVKGITLGANDKVVGMETVEENQKGYLLAIAEKGFGKRTELDEYKIQSRGGKGILTYSVTNKTGNLCGIKVVGDTEDIMLISSDGTIIRLNVKSATVLGRSTKGVTLIRMENDVNVVSIAVVKDDQEDEGSQEK